MDIKKVLNENEFSFKKKYGQNFILDTNLLKSIVDDSKIEDCDTVVEVGAGAGTLTREISKECKNVISFEIDKKLKPILEETLKDCINVELIFEDALSISHEELKDYTLGKYKVVANLPYYITTPAIFHFMEDENCQSLTIMVQKEVANRLIAPANSANYGAITVQIEALGEAHITRSVNRQLFYPVPNVDSAIVRIDKKRKEGIDNYDILKRLIASGFQMRRKTLVNNIMSSFCVSREGALNIVTSNGYIETIRGEALNIYDYIKLANTLNKI